MGLLLMEIWTLIPLCAECG